jgi:hypothetical protein
VFSASPALVGIHAEVVRVAMNQGQSHREFDDEYGQSEADARGTKHSG